MKTRIIAKTKFKTDTYLRAMLYEFKDEKNIESELKEFFNKRYGEELVSYEIV